MPPRLDPQRLAAHIEAVFAAEGPLARLLPGYQPRRAQIDMALMVAENLLQPRGRLAIDAGTGTGKSLAYLVPSLLTGMRVIIATGTKALQDQLVDKDAPVAVAAVTEILEGERILGAVLRMKGRNNYLCKLRFESYSRQQGFAFDDTLVQLTTFAENTKTGDRAELVGLPDNLPLWRDLDADRDHCLGTSCPKYEECHVVRMRRSAEEAAIIVVNHHLLCADFRLRMEAGDGDDFARVLPRADALIIDEAHSLPDVATDHFGLSLSSEDIVRLMGDARRLGDECSGDVRADVMDACDELDGASKAFFRHAMAARDPGDLPRRGGARPSDANRSERGRYVASDEGKALAAAVGEILAKLGDTLEQGRTEVDGDEVEGTMQRAALDGLRERVGRIRAELSYLAGQASADDRFVCFVDSGPRSTTLTAAPIDVSGPLSGSVFEADHPVLMTSATLAVGDDLSAFLKAVGLMGRPEDEGKADAPAPASPRRAVPRRDDDTEIDGAVDEDAREDTDAEGDTDAEDVDAEEVDGEDADGEVAGKVPAPSVRTAVFLSPFDHAHRAALYVPSTMPEPDNAGWAKAFDEEALALLELSQGGALLLFTSHRGLDDAVNRLRPALEALNIPLLRQGDRPKGVLLEELRQSGRAALFATASFWEGVDVRGAALRLVIIDRLPFRVPSDPLVRARAESVRTAGRDPFQEISVPEAALTLKQGAGRLLRSVDDAGVVAVLDGRIRRRGYGATFLAALPPMTRVGARKTLVQFWERFVVPALAALETEASPPSAPATTVAVVVGAVAAAAEENAPTDPGSPPAVEEGMDDLDPLAAHKTAAQTAGAAPPGATTD